MKKIILISIVASGMLFAGSVNNLTTNVNNDINNGGSPIINNSQVSQGHTIVSGDSDINTLGITQTENKITETGIESATVTQGLTHINNGTVFESSLESTNGITGSSINSSIVNQGKTTISDATLKSSTINSDNTIGEDSAITNASTVNQGTIIVNDGAELEDTTVTSTNALTAIVEASNVSQATLELNSDAHLDGDSEISTTNTILAGSHISASDVHQARVRIGGGYEVTALSLTETNNLFANVTGGSTVIQGGLDVCAHDAEIDASDFCE